MKRCPICGAELGKFDFIRVKTYSGCSSTLFGDIEPAEYDYRCPMCGCSDEEMEEIDSDES